MGQTDETIFFGKGNRTAWALLKEAAQTFTATWTDVGTIFNTKGAGSVAICLDFTVGTTVDAQLRITSERSSTGTNDYKNQIYSPEAGKVKTRPCVLEIDVDSTDNSVYEFPISRALDFATLQMYEAGAGTGTIANVYYRLMD